MAVRYRDPFTRYLDDNFVGIPGAELWFYEPGQTTILKQTFTDESGATANTNPVVCNAFGVIPDIFLDGTYGEEIRFPPEVAGEKGVLIDSADPVGGDITGGAFADWNETISYSSGDLVTGSDGCRYQSITNTNLNNDPANEANPADWEKILFVGVWNPNVTYSAKEIVQGSDGLMYKSNTSSNINNDPTTDEVNWEPSSATIVYNDASYWMGI